MSSSFLLLLATAIFLLVFWAWRSNRCDPHQKGKMRAADGSGAYSGSGASQSQACESGASDSCDGGGGDGGGD